MNLRSLKRNVFVCFFITNLLDSFMTTKELHLFSENVKTFEKSVNIFILIWWPWLRRHLKLEENGASTTNAESTFIFFLEKDTASISFWCVPHEDEIKTLPNFEVAWILQKRFWTLSFRFRELILQITLGNWCRSS